MEEIKISVVTPSIRPNGLERVRDSLLQQTFKNFEWLVEINWTGETDFNEAMNRMIGRARGELIVSIQDYIAIRADGLQRFWDAYVEKPGFYTAPVGKIMTEGEVPRWDWRVHKNGPIAWSEWEICYGAAPRKALIEIGGFDEILDSAWGFDNVNTAYRAHLAGYEFFCLHDNESVAIDHDAFMAHPLKHRRDPELHQRRLDYFFKGGRCDCIDRHLLV